MLGGAGIACAPLWLAASTLRSGRAIEVLKEWRDKDVSISMLRRERELTPGRVTALMGYLRRGRLNSTSFSDRKNHACALPASPAGTKFGCFIIAATVAA